MIVDLRRKFAVIYGTTIFAVVILFASFIIVLFSLKVQTIVNLPAGTLTQFREMLIDTGLLFLPIALVLSYVVGWIISQQLHTSRYTITPRLEEPASLPSAVLEGEFHLKMNSIRVAVDKMREAYDQIQHFSVNASHELRTPLTILRGEVELALRNPKSPEEYQAVLGSLLEEIVRLARIIDDLLLVARSHIGQAQFDMEPIDLKQFIEEIADEAEIFTSRFNIRFALAEVRPARIIGDALKLRRVLLNLIENAVKYNKPEGSVTLALRADDDFASISVRDTGIGIPPDALHKIFERFYRVDREHSRSLGGTGLGLSIVQWIIQNHNGEVLVESRLGEGSEFILKLPLDHSPAA